MKVSISFVRKGETLFEFVGELDEGGDLKFLHNLAMDEFRKMHPNISIFDDVTISYGTL